MDKKQREEYLKNSEVNKKLLELYRKNWGIVQKVREAYNKNKVFDPHTNKELSLAFHSSCVPHNYECDKMTHKILIVGQETNGWVFKENAKESMSFTLGFLYSPQHNGKLSFTFPFDFCKSINDYNYNENYRKTYFAWVSLRKFAYNEKHNYPLSREIQNIIDNEFNILEEEIKEIIKPKIVLFLTGPNYDNYIRNQLEGIKFKAVENYTERQFARLEHKSLPENSFRIYRPEYLNRVHLKSEYLERLKKECRL